MTMPARWVELLIRIQATADDATRTLAPGDLTMFDDALYSYCLRRTLARNRPACDHPLPTGDPLHSRDPTAE